MWKYLLFLFLSLLFLSSSHAQDIRISGFVKDKTSGENLIGANIIQEETLKGTTTDYNGYFSISTPSPCSLTITFLGYDKSTITLNHKRDTIINFFLIPGIEEISEVTVSAPRKQNFNIATLNHKQMTQVPSLGGKPDVIKTLQLMPGINAQNEGTSLMLVRGGDPGQNLYLFDNTPVIYVNHLGGFTSVFNPDIINNIDVYKGGFPSRYGGKLSSVMDITQKDGNTLELKGSYAIGLTDASLTLEGPLKIKNTSFILTGRKTMIDPLMILLTGSSKANDFIIAYGFHDLNGKLTWKPKANKSYSINIYQGDDYLNYWAKGKDNERHHSGNIWGNFLVSLQYKSALTPRLYSSGSLSLTRYRLKESVNYSVINPDTVDFSSRFRSIVQDLSYTTDWKYNVIREWQMEFGLQLSYLKFIPNDFYYSNKTNLKSTESTRSLENAIYLDNKITLLNNLWLTPGIRVVNYMTSDYMDFSFEPRLNLTKLISPYHSVNFSYMKVSQFSHLILIAGDIMNNEVWIPGNKKIAPAESDQYSIGWKGEYLQGKYSSEVNFFYKRMQNLSTFREGYTSLAGDNDWLSKIETGGKGKSEGIEIMVKKNSGQWTGFISYAFSGSTRQYPNINRGKEFIFDYDRPNSLSINLDHKINDRLRINLVWIYQSGLPYTKAIGRQYLPPLEQDWDGNKYYHEALVYGERNSDRMKDYHRLDIGINWSTLTKRRGNKAEWNFSVYNAYNRRNPVYYYYNSNSSGEIYKPEHTGQFKPISLYQLSLFPLIPTLSYKVYFNSNSKFIPEKAGKTKTPFKVKFNNWLFIKS